MAGLLERLRGAGARLLAAASGKLAPAPTPKVSPKQKSFPSYLTNTETNDQVLPLQDRRSAQLDHASYRLGASTRQVIRDFAAVNPDLSAAVFAYCRVAITDTYSVRAYNVDGTFNREATALVQQIATRIDVLGNYDDGFSGVSSLRSTSESLVKELMYYGGMALELVLDKTRLPRTFAPVSITQVQFKADDRWLKPVQVIGGEEIDLDQPTFFYCSLDQLLTEAYAASPLEPAIQPVLFSIEFMNDLRRVIKRAIHPRLNFKIDEDKFRKNIPAEFLHDDEKLRGYMNGVIAEIEATVADLSPEDALVFFDSIGVEYLNNGNQSLDAEYKVLQGIANSKMATGAKALPSILGHGSGSQNVSSSETLLFMKNATGAQMKLNEIYSKAFTLAARLFGEDVYVEFAYAPIDLRPETELESFRSMRQSRILEQLSLGFLTDDEASLELTGQLTPAGFKPLSGTQFFNPPKAEAEGGNPNSNTSGPQNRRTSTPEKTKGPQKKADNVIALPGAE
jgi:hypothetical protein